MGQAYDLYQMADALRISHWTLRKHIKRGSINVTRMGNRIRVTQGELERLLRDGLPSLTGVGPNSQPLPASEAA